MSKPIIGKILKGCREIWGLTQHELAKKAKISKDTLSRLELGKQPGTRRQTVKALADALKVEPGVLTGDLPVPNGDDLSPNSARYPAHDPRHSFTSSLDADVFNGYTLVSRRYRIPMERIIDLAPLLFVLAAERSLERRRVRLTTLKEALNRAASAAEAIHDMSRAIDSHAETLKAMDAEDRSIADRDILGEDLNRDEDGIAWVNDMDNPFICSIQQDAPDPFSAEITNFCREDSRILVCRGDALCLTDGDADLADEIIMGSAIINDIPSELLVGIATKERVAWLRDKTSETRKSWELSWANLHNQSVSNEGV